MIHLLLAASLSTAVPAALPESVVAQVASPEADDAKPAMFVVRDQDTTIYIFGTFHALDGQSDWFSGNLRTAFEGSDELVLETLLPEHTPLPAAAPATVRSPFAAYSVAPSASFLSTTRLALSAGRARGMNVANGADMVLRHIAESEGKQVEGLETLGLQLRMFNRMPATMMPNPRKAASSKEDDDRVGLSNTMSDMEAAWKRGDQTVFVRLLDELRRSSPEGYRMMFTERNARWADWIAARLRTPGTVFVAVGAGHLVGKDSVLVRLAEHGIESSRLN